MFGISSFRIISITTLLLITLTIQLLLSCIARGETIKLDSIEKLADKQQKSRIKSDLLLIKRYRKSLNAIIDHIKKEQETIVHDEDDKNVNMLKRYEKESIWRTWQCFYDYIIAIDSIKQFHVKFYKLEDEFKSDSFYCRYAAYTVQYRFALEFIELMSKYKDIDIVLNEAVPELGLGENLYAGLKFKFLNVAAAFDFFSQETVRKYYAMKITTFQSDTNITADREYLWEKKKGTSQKLTIKNGWKIVKSRSFKTCFPIQAGISEWMGDAKVWRKGVALITEKQIHQFLPNLQPGDILIERREWYLSNIGLPGYWPHAALYVGTKEERNAFFSNDKETADWVKQKGEKSGSLEDLLIKTYKEAYALSQTAQEKEHLPRVVEAMSEGVLFTTIEHSADCDSMVVLRPRLSKKEKARAVMMAFHYSGRPYDFNFDFVTDSTIVCTELIYKAYEPLVGFKGMVFPLTSLMGHKVTTANDMIKQFDAQYGTNDQQSDMILFLDGDEKNRRADSSTVKELRDSWKRSKWHIITQ